MTKKVKSENVRVAFGKHKGELFTRVPLDYLKWMACKGTRQSEIADAELARRGTVTPKLDVSGHAVDRASQRCLHLWESWKEDSGQTELGLWSWLAVLGAQAIHEAGGLDNVAANDGLCDSYGVRFIFEASGRWPVLKTVRVV